MESSDISAFVRVVQSGSFTAAAKLAGMPKSTLSAKVAALERRLGVTLLLRTTRKLRLTSQGEDFFRACANALSEIEAAEAVVSSGQASPRGRVALTAPTDTGRFLASFLVGFLAAYPDITIDLVLTNRYVDLVGEGIDVAIRGGVLADSSLVAKRLAMHRRGLFAAPLYLQGAGVPQQPRDLERHLCLLSSGSSDEWRLVKGAQNVRVKVRGRISVDELSTLKDLAVNGHGIALLPTFMSTSDVAANRLVAILPDWATDETPLSLVYPAHKYQHPKVRALVEALATSLTRNCDDIAYIPLIS